MANTSVSLVGLDFNSLKTNLKNFLKTNSSFKDIDFEASNINVLLDVLAYNSYLNNYYVNMVASEMFLDTAQLRDSIVSHAKELNYTPRSFVSSSANVVISVTPASSSVISVVIPKYTSFSSRIGSNTYTFSTNESLVLTTSNSGTFSASARVYEGIIVTETFIVDDTNTKQRFIISNPTVDTASLNVTVYEDSGQNELAYSFTNRLVGINANSQIFFIQPTNNFQYEIKFGDNVYGRKPKNGSTIVVKYRACSGELPNGASVFIPDGAIDGHSNVAVTTVSGAVGGTLAETTESIRFNAPRKFQTQDRAITATDYEVLLQTQFSDIKAISVYGGEEATPPQYGKVYVSVDVANAEGASVLSKQAYFDYIKDRSPISINVEFIDPEFMYVKVDSKIKFNINKTTKTTEDITSLVKGAISSYSFNSLENFKTTLFYSNFLNAIDQADPAIIGNDTSILLIKRFTPTLNTAFEVILDFQNELDVDPAFIVDQLNLPYGYTLYSSSFTYSNVPCLLVNDSLGNVHIATRLQNVIQLLKVVGRVNFTTGVVQLDDFNISDYQGSGISVYVRTKNRDIQSVRNTILGIDLNDVTVSSTGVKA
jgi:hypothetical protein